MALTLNDVQKWHQSRQFEKAQAGYIEILQADPNCVLAWNNLGTIYHAKQQFEEAINCYLAVIEKKSDDASAYYNLGLALLKLNRLTEAQNAFFALCELQPTHFGARFQLALLWMRAKKYSQALCLLNEMHRDDPSHLETKVNLGHCYLELGQLHEAQQFYLQALQEVPNDVQLLFNLGVLNGVLGHIRKSISFYLRAVKINNHFYDAHYNLGVAYLFVRQKSLALLHLKEASYLKPQNKSISHLVRVLSERENISDIPHEYLTDLFDHYAKYYDAHLSAVLVYQLPSLLKSAFHSMSIAKQSRSILDLGCGTGLCGDALHEFAKSLVGVDLSKAMLDQAQNKSCYDELIQEDALSFLQRCDDIFDVVVAGDFFVYLGDLSRIFAAVAQRLIKDGLFIFNVESLDKGSYELGDTGRFRHHRDYVEQLITQYRFALIECRLVMIRRQDKTPVDGYLYFLRKL